MIGETGHAAGPGPVQAERDPISPSSSDDIDFFGVINVDVEAEPAKLAPADGGRCGPRKSWG